MANKEVDGDIIGLEAAISIFLLFLMAKNNPAYNKGLMLVALVIGVCALCHIGVATGRIAVQKGQETGNRYLYCLLAYCALILWLWLS